jgi:hypothetical protein
MCEGYIHAQICTAKPTLRTLACHPQPRDQQAWFRGRDADMPCPIGAYVRGRGANPAHSTDLFRFLILAGVAPGSRGTKPIKLEPATSQIKIIYHWFSCIQNASPYCCMTDSVGPRPKCNCVSGALIPENMVCWQNRQTLLGRSARTQTREVVSIPCI